MTVPKFDKNDENNEHWTFLPLEDALNPMRGGIYKLVVNKYWNIHPEKGLVFYTPRGRINDYKGLYGAPQCNSNENIARRLCPEWAEVRFMTTVWYPMNIRDFVD